MKAIVLSGGQGLRMRPLTEDKPKPLILVNGRPIAEHQIEWLKRTGDVDGVVFACGYRWEKLKEHFGGEFQGVSIDYSVEDEPLGTGGAIRKALEKLSDKEETVLVTNGDVITDLEVRRLMEWHMSPQGQTTATMLVVPYRSRFGVVHIDKLRMIRKFEEKPEFPDVWINGGIYALNLKRIRKSLPEKGDIERETFPKLVTYGEISSFPFYGFWRLIDSIKDLSEVEAELRAKKS
jgi:mannose-1-phosphate guanylyltransferase